jgi:hypothetical protein
MRANVFRSHAAGPSGDHAALTFIDWQLVHARPPGLELPHAWVHSLEPDVRRKELELLREYRATLVRLNPAAQSYNLRDAGRGLLPGLLPVALAQDDHAVAHRRRESVIRERTERHCSVCLRSALRGIGAATAPRSAQTPESQECPIRTIANYSRSNRQSWCAKGGAVSDSATRGDAAAQRVVGSVAHVLQRPPVAPQEV